MGVGNVTQKISLAACFHIFPDYHVICQSLS